MAQQPVGYTSRLADRLTDRLTSFISFCGFIHKTNSCGFYFLYSFNLEGGAELRGWIDSHVSEQRCMIPAHTSHVTFLFYQSAVSETKIDPSQVEWTLLLVSTQKVSSGSGHLSGFGYAAISEGKPMCVFRAHTYAVVRSV